MNKAELIDELTKKLDADRKTATEAVELIVDTIVRAVNRGESVTITGFGVFEKRRRAPRVARNPRTGETVKVRATSVPAFRPGAQFKAVDRNGDGRLDREEYRQAITDGFYFRDRARRGYLTADQLPEAPPDAFKAASVDGDDRLSLQEEVNALLKDFEAADVNNDGALTYGELEAYVTRSRR